MRKKKSEGCATGTVEAAETSFFEAHRPDPLRLAERRFNTELVVSARYSLTSGLKWGSYFT